MNTAIAMLFHAVSELFAHALAALDPRTPLLVENERLRHELDCEKRRADELSRRTNKLIREDVRNEMEIRRLNQQNADLLMQVNALRADGAGGLGKMVLMGRRP